MIAVAKMTVKQLVRFINARESYTYFATPSEKVRVVEARVRGETFQVRGLHDGKWFVCCPSEIIVER